MNYLIVSVLVWSALAFAYFTPMQYNVYLIFLIGIPVQVMIILWPRIRAYKV